MLLAAVLVSGCSPAGPTVADPGAAVDATTAPDAGPSRGAPGRSGLVAVSVRDLPPEARAVLEQVEAGGPFEYRQDGQTFQNREGRLPPHPTGFYREFTVVTPGSPDRGARRLVVGEDGIVFYTSDHYQSFHEVIP